MLYLLFGVLAYILSQTQEPLRSMFNRKRIQKEWQERESKKQLHLRLLSEITAQLVREAIDAHGDTLARKRTNLLLTDEYGLIVDKGWKKDMEYFYENVIEPKLQSHASELSISYILAISDAKEYALKLIDMRTQLIQEKSGNDAIAAIPTNPYEYEGFCCKLLERAGWSASATPKSGDQGADVIAKRNGVILILQCKLWNSPVGNKAVQEIAAAKTFYSANKAAVISNQPYTPSAKLLAASNEVLLLHHNDLVKLFTDDGIC